MERIYVFGASGSGTTTLGAAIAKRAKLKHVDCDDHFWAPSNPPFSQKTPSADRVISIRDAIGKGGWVLSGSCMGWGDEITQNTDLIVFVTVNLEVRMQRLLVREEQKFGIRIKQGGDMYEIHRDFIAWAKEYENSDFQGLNRARHENWLSQQTTQTLTVNGEFETDNLVNYVLEALRSA